MEIIGKTLIKWYLHTGRTLPWRETRDPYLIWISEIILQQTQVKQGLSYYKNFIDTFPDIFSLANATDDQILKVWEGLGYYSRVNNMQKTAHILISNRNGVFPETVDELMALPGIGPYTARAIAAFAFNAQVGVLDGNVFRVISRVLAETKPIDKNRVFFQDIVDKWAAPHSPVEFNNAIMEFGALQCKPNRPHCSECCLKFHCIGFSKDIVSQLPVKSAKRIRTKKYFDFYYSPNTENKFIIQKRGKTGIWKGLWEIPNSERTNPGEEKITDIVLATHKHAFTHFDMYMRLILKPEIFQANNQIRISVAEIEKYPFPTAIRILLAKNSTTQCLSKD